MEIERDGVNMVTDIMGGFKCDGKEYAVCSYEDTLDNHKIIILQTEKNGDTITTKEIPDEDVRKVVQCYGMIKDNLMEDEYE